MTTFEQFVAGLGPDAKKYKRSELKRLYGDVQKLADVLLEVHLSRSPSKHRAGSQQTGLDRRADDRTIRSGITEHAEGGMLSRVQHS